MATRQDWDNKIKKLNKQHVKSGKELNAVLEELVKTSIDQISYYVAIAILKVYPRLIQRTPVDTGRARAAWHIDTKQSEWVPEQKEFEEYKNQVVAVATSEVNSKMDSLTKADVIRIINNVEYILALEAGWSKQSSGFIGLMLEELKGELSKIAKLRTA